MKNVIGRWFHSKGELKRRSRMSFAERKERISNGSEFPESIKRQDVFSITDYSFIFIDYYSRYLHILQRTVMQEDSISWFPLVGLFGDFFLPSCSYKTKCSSINSYLQFYRFPIHVLSLLHIFCSWWVNYNLETQNKLLNFKKDSKTSFLTMNCLKYGGQAAADV